MCLAVPMKLIQRDGEVGKVELGGVQRDINLMLLPEVTVGEYVMVHAGFAIQKLDEEEALKTLDILMQMSGDFGDDPSLNFGTDPDEQQESDNPEGNPL
ncbi:MAG: hypothetical protein Kow0042_22650 [Calditrichia bacterium]